MGAFQTVHYLQRPVADLPQWLECVFFANWILLLMYSISFLCCLGWKTAAWAARASRKGEELHPIAGIDWRFFVFSFEAAMFILCISTFWTAAEATRDAPVSEALFKACVQDLREPGLRYLAQNLPPAVGADEFRVICMSAFYEDRKALIKPPESRAELLRRYGPQ